MFDFLFNPQGRISRKGMWLGYLLPYLAISLVLSFAESVVPALAVLSMLVGLFYLWPSIATGVKRLHDLGRSGWWMLGLVLLSLLSVIGFFVGVGMGAYENDRVADLEAMGTMTPDQQAAVMAEVFPMGFTNPVGLISAVVFGVLVIGSLVVFYVLPGQRRDNQYGRDPLAEGRGFAD